jgi:hypothetical protein
VFHERRERPDCNGLRLLSGGFFLGLDGLFLFHPLLPVQERLSEERSNFNGKTAFVSGKFDTEAPFL